MNVVKDISFSQYDNKRWIVATPDQNHILVNSPTKILLEILRDAKSESDALDRFNEEFDQALDSQSFKKFLFEKFENKNILNSEEEGPFRRRSYLNIKVTLFPPGLAGALAKPFMIFFRPTVFWITLGVCFVFNSTLGILFFSFEGAWISVDKLLLFSLIMYLTMLIHELGHIAACKKFRINHGEIGFGFYSFFPVLYADVTQIWTLNKHKRTIANLGGIYFELIYATSWGICFLVTKESFYLILSVSILFKTLTELNPFIRFDGYWIISDLTSTPNMLPKANEMFTKFILQVKSGKKELNRLKWNSSTYLLLIVYGFANQSVIIIYIIWMITEFWSSIINFPLLVLNLFQSVSKGDLSLLVNFFSFENLMIFGFYLLVIRWLINFILKGTVKYKSVTELGLYRVGR